MHCEGCRKRYSCLVAYYYSIQIAYSLGVLTNVLNVFSQCCTLGLNNIDYETEHLNYMVPAILDIVIHSIGLKNSECMYDSERAMR